MTKQQASELMDIVIDRAPKLREAGVRSISIAADGSVSLKLGTPAGAEPSGTPEARTSGPPDIWEDDVLFPKKDENKKKGGDR